MALSETETIDFPVAARNFWVFVAPASRRPDGRAGCPPDSRWDAGATTVKITNRKER
jgi:hypothetical protein